VVIKKREAALSSRFDLARARRSFSGEDLYLASDALAGANIVTQYTSEVRQASKLWQGIAKAADKADLKDKSAHLREVAEHLQEAQEFAEDPRLRKMFGSEFEGHNSDFDIYATAASLLKNATVAMASLSPALQSAAQSKILDESVNNLRRLRTRFPIKQLERLERWLLKVGSSTMPLNAISSSTKLRCVALSTAMQSGQGIARPGAIVGLSRTVDGSWSVAADLGDWRRRREQLTRDSTFRRDFGSTTSDGILEPETLKAALAEAKALGQCGISQQLLDVLSASKDPAGVVASVKTAARRLDADLASLRVAWAQFAKLTRLDEQAYLGSGQPIHKVPMVERATRHNAVIQSKETLLEWIRYKKAFDVVAASPAVLIAEHYRSSDECQPRLADVFELCLARTLIRHQLETEGQDLADLSGTTLDDARARFAKLDKEMLVLDAARIAAKTVSRPIVHGNDRGPRSSWTELALIENESKKKKRHVPLRDLINRSPQALSALKPVWMMSPLTVAQYLPRIENFFDVVVIDEASQMKPADAVGSLARARQAIIVGDPMQLPPTEFFGATLDQSDEQQGAAAGQSSILDLAEARLRRTRMLRWHYRSRHESLIAFSNRHFYDNRLVVFPTAASSPDLGVENIYVGGRYLGGGTNPDESQAIVDRARQLIERDPSRSMGLVTTNTDQRELVLEVFEKLASSNRKVADFRARWQDTLEPLFVKNLENVQGDERDTILISTVFGPGETGKVAQRFGPINSESGHRRLNVLFTRAKRKLVLVTSLRSADVLVSPTSNKGVKVLKDFLEFASTGRVDAGIETGHAADSDFEIHVADRLRQAGYDPVPQVGVDGFRIDIGVRHPSWPNGFLAGVECDGATYHSGVTVRDRDRLRQEILEGLGWRLYRVWSTDWFADQNREMGKLLAWLKQLRETLD
jgi:hypothetical protein